MFSAIGEKWAEANPFMPIMSEGSLLTKRVMLELLRIGSSRKLNQKIGLKHLYAISANYTYPTLVFVSYLPHH